VWSVVVAGDQAADELDLGVVSRFAQRHAIRERGQERSGWQDTGQYSVGAEEQRSKQ